MEESPRCGYGENNRLLNEKNDDTALLIQKCNVPRVVEVITKSPDVQIVPKAPPGVPFGRWNPDNWKPAAGVGPSTFLGSYQRARVEGRRGRTYWEWKAAEMQKVGSGDEGDDEMTSLESGTLKERTSTTDREYLDANTIDDALTPLLYPQQQFHAQSRDNALQYNNNNYEAEGMQQREELLRQDRDAVRWEGQGAAVQNEGSLYYESCSQDRAVPVVGGVRVLPPFATHQYANADKVYPSSVHDQRQTFAQYQSSVQPSATADNNGDNSPIAKVRVTSFVQPKFYTPSSSVVPSPSAPTREQIYNEPSVCELRSQPIGEESESSYKLIDVPAWTRQDSSSPSLSGILKKPPRPSQDETKVHNSSKIKFKNGEKDKPVNDILNLDLGTKPPIPGKSSTSSSSKNSPLVVKGKPNIAPENIFSRGPDSRPDIFSGRSRSTGSYCHPGNSQDKSAVFSCSSKVSTAHVNRKGASQSVVLRGRDPAVHCRRGAVRESGALVWVSQPGGGAKLDWVPTPNLSTLRSQSSTPGACITRQGSDAGRETRPPDQGGGQTSIERMQSFKDEAVASTPATCSPPILKHTQSCESKNVRRSAPGSARPEGRSVKPGEAEDCVVAVPGRASGQIVRIRVRPEVHAYLAGLPVTSSPSLGERRDSIRSVHSTHSSSASALTGCSESGGEGSAGYHEQDYSAVVDEYTLLQRAVVDHDAEALHLLSAAEAAVDPRQRLLMAAGQCHLPQLLSDDSHQRLLRMLS